MYRLYREWTTNNLRRTTGDRINHRKNRGAVKWVKKKINRDLEITFPKYFNTSYNYAYCEQLKKRGLAQIRYAIEGNTEQLKIIKAVDEFLIINNKPKDFQYDNPKNELRQIDSSFESICISMETAGISNPSELVMYKFYKRLEYLEDKYKKTTTKK